QIPPSYSQPSTRIVSSQDFVPGGQPAQQQQQTSSTRAPREVQRGRTAPRPAPTNSVAYNPAAEDGGYGDNTAAQIQQAYASGQLTEAEANQLMSQIARAPVAPRQVTQITPPTFASSQNPRIIPPTFANSQGAPPSTGGR